MNYPFSIWSQFYHPLSPEEAILEFEKDGMTHIELSHEHSTSLLERSPDHLATGRDFAAFIQAHGITARQGHLAFPNHFVTDPNFFEMLVRQIELYGAIGIERAVLHVDTISPELSTEDLIAQNAEMLKKLLARIEHVNVILCLENCRGVTRSVDELLELIRLVDSPKLGICLDTGHLNITKTDSQADFIRKAGSRLKALHIADNEGVNDQHLAPFGCGTVNFFEVVKALDEIGYDGIFNYEIPGESCRCPLPLRHEKVKWIRAGYEHVMKREN